jgi:hypothetical protein
MLRVRRCRASIGDKEHLVVHHHRIPCRRFTADLRHGAGNDERVDPSLLQAGVQIRGAQDESAEAALEDDHILLGHVQLRPERVPRITRRECLDKASTTFRREEMLKKDRPSADRLGICRVLRIDHSPTCGAKGGADAIDIGNDHAGHRHFRHLTLVHEAVLQIDDDVRRVAWTEAVEHRDAPTVAFSSFADRVEDAGLMHGFVPCD